MGEELGSRLREIKAELPELRREAERGNYSAVGQFFWNSETLDAVDASVTTLLNWAAERDEARQRAERYKPFVEMLSRMCFCGRGDGDDWHRSWTCNGCKARLALAADPPGEAGGDN